MGDRILIRFNTKFASDPLGRTWRVLVNGEEALAHKVEVEVPCSTITEPIATGEVKHHFLCFGKVTIDEHHVATVSGV
jgi:hypothetical protein